VKNDRGYVRNMTHGSAVAMWAQHREHLEVAPMADTKLLSLAHDLRVRAREVLAKAETMRDADARRKMHEVAAGYERLAQRLEEASDGGKE
jgi:hypothetical protein